MKSVILTFEEWRGKRSKTDQKENTNDKGGGSYWKWLGSKEGTGKITDFSSDLSKWWTALFKNSKNDIPKAVENISGSWEKVLIVTDRDQIPKQAQ